MLSEKQIRYLEYLAQQANRKIEISDSEIKMERAKYPFSADESGYKNTVYNLQFNIQYGCFKS